MNLVAPRIPETQDYSVPFLKGFSAIAAIAERKRQAEMETRRLALQDKIHQDSYELDKRRVDAYEKSVNSLSQYRGRQVQANADTTQAFQELNDEALTSVQELQLDNPKLITENPILYAANVRKFNDMWRTAPPQSGIPRMIQDYNGRLAQIPKIPLTIGVQYDKDKNRIPNTGSTVQMPVTQIVEQMYNSDQSDLIFEALKSSGYTKDVPTETQSATGGKIAGTSTEPIDFIKKYVRMGKGVDFSRGTSRISGNKFVSGKSGGMKAIPVMADQPAQSALSASDQQAFDWAQANPDDPRSAAILNKLGVQ